MSSSNDRGDLVKMHDNEMQKSNVGICKETFSYTSIQTPTLSNDPNLSVAIHADESMKLEEDNTSSSPSIGTHMDLDLGRT